MIGQNPLGGEFRETQKFRSLFRRDENAFQSFPLLPDPARTFIVNFEASLLGSLGRFSDLSKKSSKKYV